MKRAIVLVTVTLALVVVAVMLAEWWVMSTWSTPAHAIAGAVIGVGIAVPCIVIYQVRYPTGIGHD